MPKLVSLCCGGGGDSVGYWRSGFDVTGVDLNPQPFYPFEFIRGNVLALDYDFLMSFDAIHASPPCQAYSPGSAPARSRGKTYPDLIDPVRAMLIATGLPYIIENVQGAPIHGIGLCGSMFGLNVLKRHRIFESNILLSLPETPCTCYEHRGNIVTVAGSSFGKDEGAIAMGIDWPIDKFQLKEAVPPAYTEFLGRQLLKFISEARTVSDFISYRRSLSVSERRGRSKSDEAQRDSVSERRGLPVSYDQAVTVSPERRCVPVTRRCGFCGIPLPHGTARRKYCNGNHRLQAFKAKKEA